MSACALISGIRPWATRALSRNHIFERSLAKYHLNRFDFGTRRNFGLYRSAKVPSSTNMTPSATSASLPDAIQGLAPESLWRFFAELSEIPRPSKHEGKVLDWLKRFADTRGLKWKQDAVGNLCIYRPGSGGGENAAPVIIQGHVDMVTEKNNDVEHDFLKDPIILKREGDWITADGTTLGADNGIGVCTALAVLDLPQETKLPPIEALFTIDEETGLTGAFSLDGSLLNGRVMLNLDTEEWPEIFIGCAGGGDTILELKIGTEEIDPELEQWEVSVSGLLGGHSGLEIHEDRANAIRLAAVLVDAIIQVAPNSRLIEIKGGDKRNAIPRECTFVIGIVPNENASAKGAIENCAKEFALEYGTLEKDLGVSIASPQQKRECMLSKEGANNLINLLLLLPHGVIKKSHDVPDLVETSSNMASVKIMEDEKASNTRTYLIQSSTRSSLMPPLERTRNSIRRIGLLNGATVHQDDAYPGWVPRPDANIVALAKEEIAAVVGRTPQVKAIHAGLECGIIGEKLRNPDVESVSYGPTIHGAHSPDECVQISTVEPFWNATLRILARLAEKQK